MGTNQNSKGSKILLKKIISDTYLTFLDLSQDHQSAYEQTLFALSNLLGQNTYHSFTPKNNIQTIIETVFPNSEDCIDVILDDFVDIMLKYPPKIQDEIPLSNAITITNNSHGKEQVINALKMALKENRYDFFSRYHDGNEKENYREILKNSITLEDLITIIASKFIDTSISEKQYENINHKINTQYENKIHNFKINKHAFNKCRKHILNGEQTTFKNYDYNIGKDLYASIDIGFIKQNQEDSVIILKHPQNQNFKMLVIADGMGGLYDGEKASSYITSSITHWFESLNPQYFKHQNIDLLLQCFEIEIQNISKNLYNTYRGKTGSTFVGAIVSDKETIVSNVGDSRAYIYSKGKLQQLTEDDSVSYGLWKEGKIPEKDDIRFHKCSNLVTQGMGLTRDINPTTSIISNASYDTLLLFSDGVTDCLSDSDIMAITNKTPIKNLAKTLVSNAKHNNSERTDLNPNEYIDYIPGGKDNTTAAVYDNHSNQEGR